MRKAYEIPGYSNKVILGQEESLFEIVSKSNRTYCLEFPNIEIDGNIIGNQFCFTGIQEEMLLSNGGREIVAAYQCSDTLQLKVQLRIFPNSPFIKFRYQFSSDGTAIMTKSNGRDEICYTKLQIEGKIEACTELQFAQYDPYLHSYCPNLEAVIPERRKQGISVIGPAVITSNESDCVLLAYEHGAMYPDGFLDFNIQEHDNMTIMLQAKKGNYYSGQRITREKPFQSCWFEVAVCEGGQENMFRYYREFILDYISLNHASREPYIYYNTWNNQERNRNFKNLPYLSEMTEEQMLKEIDIAYRLGVDVFVIDTGWYQKTGDWEVDQLRFPGGFKHIREKLEAYRMKFGLWMNPIAAAKTSTIIREHPEYSVEDKDGMKSLGRIWETEESYEMCFASDYSEYLIDTMLKLHREMGVSYFKWDGIGQYGCQSAKHHHGDENNSIKERLECYSYQMGIQMIRVVEEVARQCPEIIVDFDITEEKRFVGLGFLSVGKYFLTNNGPYAKDFELPQQLKLFGNEQEVFMEPFMNIFSFPTVMRSRICRQNVKYDFIAPSILFLSHFFPDGSEKIKRNAMAAMSLGGNGIWGDLLSLTDQEITKWNEFINSYKQVAGVVTRCYPETTGFLGSSPEIYEKIKYKEGIGLIFFFTNAAGTYTYITKQIAPELKLQVIGSDLWERRTDGSVMLQISLENKDSKTILILTASDE